MCMVDDPEKGDEVAEIAPNVCPECGAAAYVGMNNVECTNHNCRHHHEETRLAYIKEHAKSGSSGEPVLETLPYRVVCSDCGLAADFERWLYANGSLAGWCPHCGQPNYWGSKTADFGDEDTDPMLSFPSVTNFPSPTNKDIQDAILDYLDPTLDKGID